MTDISTIVAAARTVDIKHPASGEPVGLKVTLQPDSDPKVKAARRRWLNERLQRGNSKVTAEKLEAQALAVIEAAVTAWDWEGDLTFRGEKPEFNAANLRKVLKELPWVQNQIEAEFGDDAAFFQN